MSEPHPTTAGRESSQVSLSAAWLLLASVVLTAILYLVPYGRVLAWPLVLLSSLVHEMGHGVAAMIAGGRFEMLQLWNDGSGAATYSGHFGRFGSAFVAVGGLLGPAVVAAVGFMLGRRPAASRIGLLVFGAALLAAEILVVRTVFGFVFVALIAVASIAVAVSARPVVAQLTLLFVSVQLALSVFSRGDYLFTRTALTAAGPMPSDTAQIAAALLLPYWVWGALCGVASVAVLVFGLWTLLDGTADGT